MKSYNIHFQKGNGKNLEIGGLVVHKIKPEQVTVDSVVKQCSKLAGCSTGLLLAGGKGPQMEEGDVLKATMWFRISADSVDSADACSDASISKYRLHQYNASTRKRNSEDSGPQMSAGQLNLCPNKYIEARKAKEAKLKAAQVSALADLHCANRGAEDGGGGDVGVIVGVIVGEKDSQKISGILGATPKKDTRISNPQGDEESQAACMPDQQQVLDNVVLKQRLGRGGEGDVLAANWLGSEVAVKVFRGKFTNIDQECQNLRKLIHPNIVQFFGLTRIEESDGLVMERCEIDLDKFAKSHPCTRTNSHVIKGGKGKLADFGLSALVSSMADLTVTEVWCGTPLYKAPELYTRKAPTPAADMWSLGITLLETVTGTAPYPIVKQVVAGQSKHVPSGILNKRLPGTLQLISPENRPIFNAVLQFDPTQRESAMKWQTLLNNYQFGN